MKLKNSINFFKYFKNIINLELRKFYLNTSYYDSKISKLDTKNFIYRPNLSTFDSIIKYDKEKINIETLNTNIIWKNYNINDRSYKKLHNFFWLFSVDLKSSNEIIQSIIKSWIEKNSKYNDQVWEIDVLSKRVISWLSNSKLTYEDGNDDFKIQFNFIIRKQLKHLINQINKSDTIDDKIISCTAIILGGLCYQDEYLRNYGFNLLRKIINKCLDKDLFPKSRSLRQLAFYLKYLILIRELLKDSQHEIPDYLDETIYYLGRGYSYLIGNSNTSFLFNGNNETNNSDFDLYLKSNGYKFKCDENIIGDYGFLKGKKMSIIMDLGKAPENQFSQNYQSGPLSFELDYLGEKLICNSGYFQKIDHQLNNISRSSASHSTLTLDNSSVSQFFFENNSKKLVNKNFKIISKKVVSDNNKWILEGSHDGYLKRYGVIHNRKIEISNKDFVINGLDRLLKKKNHKSVTFEIRFHMYPGTKVTKTIDGNTILIDMKNAGWKFTCENQKINFETGLFFGKKNNYSENQNIYIYGKTSENDESINWIFQKI